MAGLSILSGRTGRGLAFGFAIAVVGLVWFSADFYRREIRDIRLDVEQNLSRLGALKARQLERWREERLFDITLQARGLILHELVRSHPDVAHCEAALRAHLHTLSSHGDYINALVTDASGRVLYRDNTHEEPLTPETTNLIQQALGSGQPTIGAFYLCASHDTLHLDVAAPLIAETGETLGAVVMIADAGRTLMEDLAEWPWTEQAGEASLVIPDEDRVTLITASAIGTVPTISVVSRAETNRLAVGAVSRSADLVTGLDTRGQPSLGYVEHLTPGGWRLVVAIPEASIQDRLRFAGRSLLILLAMSVAACGFGTLALIIRGQRNLYRKMSGVLEESERRYRDIVNATSEAIFIDDAETGRMIDVNDSMLAMYGYESKEEVLAGSIGDLSDGTPPYDDAAAQAWVRKALEEGPQTFPWLARRRDGEAFWVEVTLRRTRINGRDCMLAVARDMTQRRRIEDTLREQVDELRRWQQITLGREDRILELKKEVNHLLADQQRPPRYPAADGGTA